jgi:hypothetical protein
LEATKQLQAWIRREASLNSKDKYGVTARQHLLSGIKQFKAIGKDTSGLEADVAPLPIPLGTDYLIGLFARLSRTRAEGMSGGLPITYTEIKAYCDLTGEQLTLWELETIVAMDFALLNPEEKPKPSVDK